MKFFGLYQITLFCLFVSLNACGQNDRTSANEDLLEIISGVGNDYILNVDADQTSLDFIVKASSLPIVISNSNWIRGTASEPSYPSRLSTVTLTIEPNTNTETSRKADLEISVGNKRISILLIQGKAKDNNGDKKEPDASSFQPWIKTEACEIGGKTSREVAWSLGVGWNLGNQMDAYVNGVSSETCWGNPKATPQLFKVLKSRGFSTVRIPVTWLGHIGKAPEYKIDREWLERVRELVEMAEAAGLNVIVNIHHDGADSKYWLNIKDASEDIERNEEIKAEISSIWSQIAEYLKDKGNFLMFESFNEIHDGGWGWGANRTDGGKQYDCLNQWNQTFVEAVRNTGGNNLTRWLGVPSYVTNIDLAVDGSMKLPKDNSNKIMVAVHFYEPNDFALNASVSDWGHTGEDSKKGGVVQDEDYMKSQFSKLSSYWVDKGVPVYIGEVGPPNQASKRGKAFRNYYLEFLFRAVKESGLAAIYWDNGAEGSGNDKFGIFDHGNGNILNDSEEVINSMVRGGTCREDGYDLNWIYKNAPDFE